jgi:hypothetical protein
MSEGADLAAVPPVPVNGHSPKRARNTQQLEPSTEQHLGTQQPAPNAAAGPSQQLHAAAAAGPSQQQEDEVYGQTSKRKKQPKPLLPDLHCEGCGKKLDGTQSINMDKYVIEPCSSGSVRVHNCMYAASVCPPNHQHSTQHANWNFA